MSRFDDDLDPLAEYGPYCEGDEGCEEGNSRKVETRVQELRNCEHCGEFNWLHKTGYDDDFGVGTMWICDFCTDGD